MAVKVTVDNKSTLGDVASWSLAENATPVRVASSAGGPAQLSVRAVATDDSLFLTGRKIKISSSNRGDWEGYVVSPNVNGLAVDLTARDIIDRLDVTRTARPAFNANNTYSLVQAIQYYCYELCSLENVALRVDPSMYFVYVTVPGWEGNVWVRIKEMCAVYGYEVLVKEGVLTFRKSRQTLLPEFVDFQTPSLNIDSSSYANNVEIVHRENTVAINKQFYPPKSQSIADQTVLTVDANETITQIFTLDGSMSRVNQPVVKDSVPAKYAGPDAHYTVMGNDNLPVKAQFWKDFGGKVTVALTGMPNEIEVTVTGPTNKTYAPYSLGVSDGQNRYNTLSISGDGVLTKQENVLYPTGVPTGTTETEIGVTIDSPFISTPEQEYTAAMGAASLYGVPTASLNITQGTQGARYFSYEDYLLNVELPDISNVAGNRVKFRNNIYRVESTTISNATVASVGALDATDDDFRKLWEGFNDVEFAYIYGTWSSRDMAIEPLRTPIDYVN